VNNLIKGQSQQSLLPPTSLTTNMSTKQQPQAFYIYFKVFDLNQSSITKIVANPKFRSI
jgi:hypothetical protein